MGALVIQLITVTDEASARLWFLSSCSVLLSFYLFEIITSLRRAINSNSILPTGSHERFTCTSLWCILIGLFYLLQFATTWLNSTAIIVIVTIYDNASRTPSTRLGFFPSQIDDEKDIAPTSSRCNFRSSASLITSVFMAKLVLDLPTTRRRPRLHLSVVNLLLLL